MSQWTFSDYQRFTTPVEVTVEIDDAVFTDEMAGEINSFWSGADERLDECEGDVRKAALLMVAVELIGLAIQHDGNVYFVQRDFDRAEGFPHPMLRVTDCEGLTPLEYHEITIETLTPSTGTGDSE